MNKKPMRNPRKGLQQKYLVFLVNLKDQIKKNPYRSVTKIAIHHRVPFDLVPALVDLGIIEGEWRSGRNWIGGEPDYQMVNQMRQQAHENRNKKKPEVDDKYYGKDRSLFEKQNPEAIRVGSGYFHKAKSKSRKWRSIWSARFFTIKIKIYKLK